MNSVETTNATPIQPVEMQKPYVVVCADIASYCSREQTIGCFELVFARATDEYAACDQARQALPEGGIPLAAFDHEDLQRFMDQMASRDLQLGNPYNWTQHMTAAEMQTTHQHKVGAGEDA